MTITVYTDFNCSYCAAVLGSLDQLREDYPRDVRVVKKLFPLKPSSRRLSLVSVAAGEQGKFWEMHDLIFAYQSDDGLTDDQLVAFAEQLSLDAARFRADLDSDTSQEIVDADIAEGTALGIQGTPTLFINGRRVTGMRPIDVFKGMVDDELEAIAQAQAQAQAP